MTDRYESPLSTRYASPYMLQLFSADTRYQTWRRLWVSLARAEMELGLPITQGQVEELEAHISEIDYDCVRRREKEVRHDVMAHVYAFGQAAPSAAGIIHLGATSCYVTDNADLILYRDGLRYLRQQLLQVMANLADFAQQYRALPTLGYTHYQPAQLVTVGKRAALWLQDLESDLSELDFTLKNVKFLGCRGTTGTEASFLDLFDGDQEKISQMNRKISSDFGFEECFPVCGQTYPRKLDSRILNCLSSIAQSCYRMANDIRLLQHDRQVEEPFEKDQIGSSAMAYKRNPMRCERICSLARYLMADAMNAPMTASTQWLERTLDDSANRRIALPEGFLCADAILRLAQNVTNGLHVNERVIEKTVKEYLPFIATENLMMEAVKRGGDRQELHEIIRRCSMAATARMKDGGDCDLLDRLAGEPSFGLSRGDMERLLNPELYTGRCAQQVEDFVQSIRPLFADLERETARIEL
ncbi:adenylosuccinate lyase [Lawsonibacter sp. OA9]|uniref:Adenylosuccinate lyase n=1 Tax=Flintibacter hominis TaxID=2763048 RepID=A0A8J6JB42_9FIRM|nr:MULTISPECIES: adenylosuccinate lyase [Eubacteriales]MBC5723212.1 adenylosuccinate lyase [Flintibacter hominis]MCH1980056.1 adenylosuccinate lyase [Lawsonibacter sp. OA9]SCH16465.1 Adenylosuccinate lyase [uncultured Clostridium sp.]